jgi:hypothetical protein
MITQKDCLARYGEPEKEKGMTLWDVPTDLEIGVIPKKIYCNKDLVAPLEKAFKNIIDRGLIAELKTWDGCFNIRKKRGAISVSLHSWGVAIDINAAWNGFGKTPTMSKTLVSCFKDAGFDWGGEWTKPDGMHFQLAKLG